MKKLKIYFAGSISGGRNDAELYLQIINYLKKYGEILTEHVGDKNLNSLGEQNITSKYIHDRDISDVMISDVIVAEVSTPSLGVGYEIGRGVEHNKHILCLYRPQEGKRLSAMIKGAPNISNVEYKTIDDDKHIIDKYFNELLTKLK